MVLKQCKFIEAVFDSLSSVIGGKYVYIYCPGILRMDRLVLKYFGYVKLTPVFVVNFWHGISTVYLSVDAIIEKHQCFSTTCIINEVRLYLIYALLHCTDLGASEKEKCYLRLVDDLDCIIR